MTALDEETVRAFAVSRRAEAMPASPIRKLAPLAELAKSRGTKVYHLNIGQPDIETPACMLDRLKQIEDKVLEYSPSSGTPAFLDSLRQYYVNRVGVPIETRQILATTGGSEAILFSFIACANEGDDILVLEPFYANYRAFATMAGLNIVPVTSRGRDGFHLPPRHVFEAALTPRTRIVIVCNPNNPTGTVYTRDELEMLAGFCRDHGLFLVSDEVYREFVYDGRKAISALELKDADDRRRQSLQTLQRLRYPPRRAGDAQRGGLRRLSAHGAGTPFPSRPCAVHRRGRRRPGRGVHARDRR